MSVIEAMVNAHQFCNDNPDAKMRAALAAAEKEGWVLVPQTTWKAMIHTAPKRLII